MKNSTRWTGRKRRLPGRQASRGAAGASLLLSGDHGALGGVLFGLGGADEPARTPFLPGKLAGALPVGTYRFANAPDDEAAAVMAILLGLYRFDRYRSGACKEARLVAPDGVDAEELRIVAAGACLARDLVNTPAGDMGPQELEDAARSLADEFGASITVTGSDDLVEAGFPMIEAVGRASHRPPRLIDLSWGDKDALKVTLVGKGVCFDTGGLDIKPAAGMLLMKKDMGGAANALGLARMIMAVGLNVRLRVLIPAVENAVGGNAFRPGDILPSRKGLTVEIGNTDAEGRLVLADALTLACEEHPDLLIDLATLTGAARVALGPEVPPFFTDDKALAMEIERHGAQVYDPVWHMPLWKPYRCMLDSKIADINNTGTVGMAGSVTAALFLQSFVEEGISWAHFDIYGWVATARPGSPEGGEAQAIRALFALIRDRYSA